MNDIFQNRFDILRAKFRYAILDTVTGVDGNFTNSLQRANEYVRSCNKRRENLNLPPLIIVERET